MTYRAFVAVLSLLIANPAIADTTDGSEDGAHITTNSKAFSDSYDAAATKLTTSGFEATLANPSFGAMASSDIANITKEIKAEKPISGVSSGDPSVTYDVILQPGHYGRKGGRTGTSGAKVSERALNAYFVRGIAKQVAASGLKVLIVPAAGGKPGLKAKVFLAIHADGSVKACSTGPSLAYSAQSNPFAMHAIGMGLAHAFGYGYDKFRKDNFTANEKDYYMFHRVNAPILTGLLEVGELTCAKSEDRLISASREITNNVAAALSYLAHLESSQ